MLSNSSLQTFGTWASKGLKTAAATLESAAVAGKAVVESTLQELVESDEEEPRPNETPAVAVQPNESTITFFNTAFEEPAPKTAPPVDDLTEDQVLRTGTTDLGAGESAESIRQPWEAIAGQGADLSSVGSGSRLSSPTDPNSAPNDSLLVTAALPEEAVRDVANALIEKTTESSAPAAVVVPAVAERCTNDTVGATNLQTTAAPVDPLPQWTEAPPEEMDQSLVDSPLVDSPLIPSPSPPIRRPHRDAIPADVAQMMETTLRLSAQVEELQNWVKSLQEERDTLAEQCTVADAQCRQQATDFRERVKSLSTSAQQKAEERVKETVARLESEVESYKTVCEENRVQMAKMEAEVERCQSLLVKKEGELSGLKARLTEREEAPGANSQELVRAASQLAALRLSLEAAETAQAGLARKLKQLEACRRLVLKEGSGSASQDPEDERSYNWVPRLEERVGQILAQSEALVSSNNNLTAELNKVYQTNQQLQRKLEEANTKAANAKSSGATWSHQASPSHAATPLEDSRIETVVALEARLAAKAQRLDALVTENHALKMQLQNKNPSPFSHVQDEFQKTILINFIVRPILKVFQRFGRKDNTKGNEGQIKRVYHQVLSTYPIRVISDVAEKVSCYRDGGIMVLATTVFLFITFR